MYAVPPVKNRLSIPNIMVVMLKSGMDEASLITVLSNEKNSFKAFSCCEELWSEVFVPFVMIVFKLNFDWCFRPK